MDTFLSEFASDLLIKHNYHLADVCVVMPNRRAGLFLKKNLREQAQKTILSPEIFSVEDFLTHLTGLKVADNAALLFELFEIHKTLEGENAQPLEEFMKTAQKMLADFNDVDKYLTDPKKLFGYLSEVKAIEKWNPDGSPLTPTELDYLSFFRRLLDYYVLINQRLTARGEAYQGMIYRQAAENIETIAKSILWEKLYFAGFNALTASEERVISHLRETGIAEMVRDVDDYYISDTRQEAGFFLRKALAKEGPEKFGNIGSHFKSLSKRIYLHGTPGNTGQASLAASILNDMFNNRFSGQKQRAAIRTAVITADEKLLIPLLSALPESIGKVNVSMGYPLKMTDAFSFVISVIRLYENAERLRNAGENENFRFYFRDILALLQQPMMVATTNSTALTAAINRSKQVFYNNSELQSLQPNPNDAGGIDLLDALLKKHPPEALELLQILEDAISHFSGFYTTNSDQSQPKTDYLLQLEYLHFTATILKRIRELNTRFDAIYSIRALRETFILLTSATNLPFSGEPLEGIQIMGMLETRNLDFERVILISANEGILPADGKSNSFIPFDIRNTFNLPNHTHHNAVAAYQFYRLLQRAGEVHIIYNTEATELGGGERSRFVQQLLTEYPYYQPQVEITESVQTPSIPDKSTQRKISIAKNDDVFKRLEVQAQAGFSPTSLNQFRRCSLQFYFRNIAGVQEADEVEETIEHRTIGSIVHRVLEKLYTPYIDAFITPQIIDLMIQKAGSELNAAFDALYSGGQVAFGRNRLLYEVIKNFIYAYLDFEKTFLTGIGDSGSRLKILGLEQRIEPKEGLFSLPELPELKINFRGSIDRVDELDDTIRIIDYKTGKVGELSDLRIKDWEDFADGSKKDKPFQVLMYAWLYNKHFLKTGKPVEAGVISLRNLSNGLMKFGVKSQGMQVADEQIDALKLTEFETYLDGLFRQMFDRDEPFAQTDNLKVCDYCDYKSICNR